MEWVALASPTDLRGWRDAARRLRAAGVAPEHVRWSVGPGADLFTSEAGAEAQPCEVFRVPRSFHELAASVVLHRSEDRFDLLYRVLFRLKAEPRLMQDLSDADLWRARLYEKAVRRAVHKMHAFVRFRRFEDPEAPDEEAYAAWFEPPHFVLERGVGYFVNRLANLRFRILTPEASVLWDRRSLHIGSGAEVGAAPGEDDAEEAWRAYFSAVFNPARLNSRLMTQHMGRAYWRNLPEAQAIPDLVKSAAARTQAMVSQAASAPSVRAEKLRSRSAADAAPAPARQPAETLPALAAELTACRRCDLWREATQVVPGLGPGEAPLMLVGEQPGDAEDLRGLPFVGPAGRLLSEALLTAGIPREAAFVTNAVKHFKFEPRGKRRIHKSPEASEVKACRGWLEIERRLVRPKVIVALGSTAARALLGRPVSVLKERGRAGQLSDGAEVIVTVHPSYLLRLEAREAKAKALADFVADLKLAQARLAGSL